ncbi:MAG: hypothetical protein ABIA04_10675, partial [Pseudomonadota bacterium]
AQAAQAQAAAGAGHDLAMAQLMADRDVTLAYIQAGGGGRVGAPAEKKIPCENDMDQICKACFKTSWKPTDCNCTKELGKWNIAAVGISVIEDACASRANKEQREKEKREAKEREAKEKKEKEKKNKAIVADDGNPKKIKEKEKELEKLSDNLETEITNLDLSKKDELAQKLSDAAEKAGEIETLNRELAKAYKEQGNNDEAAKYEAIAEKYKEAKEQYEIAQDAISAIDESHKVSKKDKAKEAITAADTALTSSE